MASLQKRGGRWTLQFTGVDGKRRTIRLGKLPKAGAVEVKGRVEEILTAAGAGLLVPPDTARWLRRLGDDLHERLVRAGLVEARASATLGEFVDGYIERRTDAAEGTRDGWRLSAGNLCEFFGAETPLREITAGGAEDFRRWMMERIGENTANRRIGHASQFFRYAVRSELIDKNPFDGLRSAIRSRPERDYFLSREDTAKLIDAAPDAEWRAIIALARFGGLRVPSELVRLTWADVDWERNRFRVHSPKTAHHGKGERIVPLFPELRPHLEALFDAAPEGAVRLISVSDNALRSGMERIIRRAGLTPWPRLWNSMRASRATELVAEHPQHVATAWLGHSVAIAQEHYWRVTEDDFERAATASAAKSDARATENSTNRRKTGYRKTAKTPTASEKTGADRGPSRMPRPGRNPLQDGGLRERHAEGAAKSDARTEIALKDDDPHAVAGFALEHLEAVEQAIGRLVDLAAGQNEQEAAQDAQETLGHLRNCIVDAVPQDDDESPDG